MEKHYIREVLGRLDWNITHTAETLQISPTTLRKKINDYELRPPGTGSLGTP
jgi:DNA-binding NtrC family response regulator